jgi:RimJ/RimL family protein N-acetyltransferase
VDPVSLILGQLELEGIGLDSAGRLAPLASVEAEAIPRVYLARHQAGFVRLYRNSLPDEIVARLDQLADATLLDDRALVRHILGFDTPCTDWWEGSSYVVSEPPPQREFPDVQRLDSADQLSLGGLDSGVLSIGRPIYAVVVNGQVASTCISVRENASAAEAWVQTAPAYRRRGYARQATAAWAHDVRLAGKIAFYSHAWDNAASLGIARSLGMEWFIDAVGYL